MMKKLNLVILATTALLVTTFSSCKKENSIKQPASSTTSNNTTTLRQSDPVFDQAALTGVSKSAQGFLVFTTQDDYDNVLEVIRDFSDEQLNGWEDALAFTSAYTAFADPTAYSVNPQDNKNQGFEDPLLSRILDVSGMIQIEDFVFKAAYDNDFVLEMHHNNLNTYYNTIKAGTFNASVMNKFDGSFDDETQDVFEFLRSGEIGYAPEGATSFSMRQFKDKPSAEILTDEGGTQWKAECKTVYQNLPFYCSLFGEMKYTKKGGSVWWATKTDIKLFSHSSTCTYKPRRKGTVTRSVSDYRNDNKLNYKAYSGSRKLDNFTLSLNFNYYSIVPGWRIIYSSIVK